MIFVLGPFEGMAGKASREKPLDLLHDLNFHLSRLPTLPCGREA